MRLFLVKNGVQFDVAFGWPDDWALAAFIVMGEHEGGEWDWSQMKWVKKD